MVFAKSQAQSGFQGIFGEKAQEFLCVTRQEFLCVDNLA